MQDREPLPEDLPFRIEFTDTKHAVARFAEYVDHRRTPELDHRLYEAMRGHDRLACDVSDSVEVDSDWLALLADVTLEAEQAAKRVGVVGLRDTLKTSADLLGLDTLCLYDTIDEVWR